MPRVIDRYLLRQFLQVLFICFLSLVGLFVVIDAFGHLDHFVDFADENGNLLAVLGEYYGYKTIAFFDRTSGILALIAAMFTVTWLQRHQEMTALLAAGISRWRIIMPILVAAVAVSFLAAANREWVIPQLRHQLAMDSKNLGGDQLTDMQPSFDSATEIRLAGDKVIVKERKILRPNFMLPLEIATYGRQLAAAEAQYLPPADDRAGGYLLSGVTAPLALLEAPSLSIDDRPVVITPRDLPALKPDQVFVVSGVSFEFLSSGSTWREYASTRELVKELKSPSTDLGAGVRMAVHGRLLRPLLDTTLLFLGLPLVVKSNRNPFLAIGLCLAVVTLFMSVVLGCQALGQSGWMRPTLAAWLPLMLFVPLAAYLSDPLWD